MEEKGIAKFPLPIKDRIPNFDGSDLAAKLLRKLPQWKKAKIIMANPDYAQHKVRENVLKEGKILIMASPGLRQGFLKIDPRKIKSKESFAATIKGAFKYGEKIGYKIPKPDLKILGSVAVDLKGNRLGKGGGFGDREIEYAESKHKEILVITTIHESQIVDSVPVEKHDKKVDIIITPERIIEVQE